MCEFSENVEVLRTLIRYGADMNALNVQKCTGLHFAAINRNTDIVLELIKNGLSINAVDVNDKTPLGVASNFGNCACMLHLICRGAKICGSDVRDDKTGLLGPIKKGLENLRKGRRVTTLFSEEEIKILRRVAFCFAFKHSGNTAFNAFSKVFNFLTYKGAFMAPGFDVGTDSIWRRV